MTAPSIPASDRDKAIPLLRGIVERDRPYGQAYALLGTIYEKQGKTEEAKKVYRRAAENPQFPDSERARFREKARSLGK